MGQEQQQIPTEIIPRQRDADMKNAAVLPRRLDVLHFS
jgi:hypothetical protein